MLAYLGLGLTVAFWGASFVALKVLLRELGPATITVVRFAVGLAVLVAVSAARRELQAPRARDLPWLALLGFLGITLHQWLQATGLLSASASVTSWIVASIPVFVALLGWLVLRERLGGWRLAGILLAAAGVSLVVSNGDLRGLLAGTAGTPGDLLIAFSAVNWAVFSALSRRGLKSHPASLMMFYVMSFGWAFTSLIFLTTGGVAEISRLSLRGWTGVAFLGVFCSGLAYIAWYDALKALTTAQTGVFLYIEPLVAVVVAFFVLGEAIIPASLFGGAVILFGVWLVNRG